MSATIEVVGSSAIVTDGVWESDNVMLLQLLNTLLPFGGVSSSEPDADLFIASEAVIVTGGEVVKSSGVGEAVEGRVY